MFNDDSHARGGGVAVRGKRRFFTHSFAASRAPRALALLFLVVCNQVLAAPLRVPIKLPDSYVAALLKSNLFTLKGDALRVNDDGSGCQYLELSNPKFSAEAGFINLKADAEARVGRLFGANCVLMLEWRGQLDIDEILYVDHAKRSLRAKAKEIRIYDANGAALSSSSVVWQWAEQYLKASLDVNVVDLGAVIGGLNQALAQFFGESAQTAVPIDLDLKLGSVEVRPGEIGAELTFEAPLVGRAAAVPQLESALNAQELQQFESRLDALDAFFTYVIKKSVKDDTDAELRSQFFESLIEIRYALNAALVNPVERGGNDPMRALFVEQWNQLAPVVARVAAGQTDEQQALDLFAFVAGADALAALDTLGPEYGVEISTDGLRRLARLLVPADAEDPTFYSETTDLELEKDFDLGIEETFTPDELLPLIWDFFFRPAYAATKYDAALLKKLNNWVPKNDEMGDYLPMVQMVIDRALNDVLKKKGLERDYVAIYRATVITAAWQESCWRQYINDSGKRLPLRSGAGDIGMMQVNPRIWRGFYEAHGLKWDIAYNAQAGADILLHYFKDYAVKKGEHKVTGKMDNLARATYSAYNGGPRQLTRYRQANVSAHGRKVDKAFNEKYLQVRGGNEMAVRACFAGS